MVCKRQANKNEIWKAVKTVVKERNWTSMTGNIMDDGQVVIISGEPGIGKSTILSNYYEEIIKEKNTSKWVVRLNLVEYPKNIATAKSALNFFLRLPNVVGESSFARSLLRHRLESGDRIVLMFDGFDEIDSQCQNKTIELIASITKNPIQLFVTTRTHLIEKLQDKLF